MNSPHHVAAPFEVSRHVIFYSKEPALFSGTVAINALRDEWGNVRNRAARAAIIERCENPIENAQHPQLSPLRAVLLHPSEVHTALLEEIDADGMPIYNPQKSKQLRRQISRALKKAPELHDVKPVTIVESLTSLDGLTRIFLSITEEGVGTDMAIATLWRERAKCLNVLADVTGSEARESFGPAFMIARLPEETPEHERLTLHNSIQSAVSTVYTRGLDPFLAQTQNYDPGSSGRGFPLYGLALPEIVE